MDNRKPLLNAGFCIWMNRESSDMVLNQQQRHIVIVTETFAPEINGVANTLTQLCLGLINRDHEVTVIRPRQRGETRKTLASNTPMLTKEIRVAGFPLPGYPELRFGLARATRLVRLWKRRRPHVVYVATEGPLGLVALSAARRLGIPVCSGFHTNFHRYSQHYGAAFLNRAIAGYLRWFHNRTDLTLAPTRQMQQTLRGMGVHATSVLGRGVDCGRFTPGKRDPILRHAWGLNERDLAVLYVGRLAAEKNLQMVVNCFERLRAIHPRARLILVGDGPLRAQLQLRHPDYIFCGIQRGDELARHYACGDLFLFPSKTETFGNVVTEAMASGLAVIAFDDAAASELIRHEENGMKVPFDDSPAFVNAALRLADQPSIANRLRSRARLDALDRHWPALIEQFEHMTTTLTQQERRHGRKQSVSIL